MPENLFAGDPFESLLQTLAFIGVVSMIAYLGILLLKFALSWRYASRHRETHITEAPITILQPILSGDPFLENALRQNLEQAPSYATFLWLLDADDSVAWNITESIRSRWPGRVQLLACPPPTGNVNPKTCKLQFALDRIVTPYLAILDDDTILDDQNLGKALFALDSCDLYTGLPCYLPGANLWSALVTHFVNNNSIVTYLPMLIFLNPISINGMFYAMRTQKLRDLGGYSVILDQLCDDYALARLVKSHGGVIRQGITPQHLRTTVAGMGPYFRLMHRWFVFANVLARDQPLSVLIVMFVFLGLPPLLLWLSFLALLGGWSGLWLVAVLVIRNACLRLLHRVVFGKSPGLSMLLSVGSELLQPVHWLHSVLRSTLKWRTRAIRLERDGTFRYLPGK